MKFHAEELNKISLDYCLKTKNVAEKILQDDGIEHASTPTLKKFKDDVFKFLSIYPYYINMHRYHELAMFFNDISIETNNKADNVYILDLLSKLDHPSIFGEFTGKYIHLAQKQFLPKFEKYWQHLSKQEKKHQYYIMSWFKVLRDCKRFLCFNRFFPLFPRVVQGALE